MASKILEQNCRESRILEKESEGKKIGACQKLQRQGTSNQSLEDQNNVQKLISSYQNSQNPDLVAATSLLERLSVENFQQQSASAERRSESYCYLNQKTSSEKIGGGENCEDFGQKAQRNGGTKVKNLKANSVESLQTRMLEERLAAETAGQFFVFEIFW